MTYTSVRGIVILVNLFYYETIKRELNKRLIYECRCNVRLKANVEGSTPLGYTSIGGPPMMIFHFLIISSLSVRLFTAE